MLPIIIVILNVIIFIDLIYVTILKYLHINPIDKNNRNKYLYYHNLLDELSISEIGYIYNNGKKVNTLVKASLEYMKLKQIPIDKDKLPGKEYNLNSAETYILSCSKFIGTKEFNDRFISYLQNDLTKRGYLKKGVFKNKHLKFSTFLISLMLILNIFNTFRINTDNAYPDLFIFDWTFFCISLCIIFRNDYLGKTEKGREIYFKLRALKRYIHDFGNFNDKELEEIKLWDEWILYAIILEESNNLTDDLKKEYKSIENNFFSS